MHVVTTRWLGSRAPPTLGLQYLKQISTDDKFINWQAMGMIIHVVVGSTTVILAMPCRSSWKLHTWRRNTGESHRTNTQPSVRHLTHRRFIHSDQNHQKWCFTTFHSILFYLYTFTFVLLKCIIVFFCVWNSSDPKGKFSFDAFIMNNKVLLYNLYLHKRHDKHVTVSAVGGDSCSYLMSTEACKYPVASDMGTNHKRWSADS